MYGLRSIPALSRECEAKAKLNVWKLKHECVRQLRSGKFIPLRKTGKLRKLEMNCYG